MLLLYAFYKTQRSCHMVSGAQTQATTGKAAEMQALVRK